MILIGFLCHWAAERQLANTAEGKQPGPVSTTIDNCVPDPINVTPYDSFFVQEKTPLTVSILCSDAYVTRKAEVL